VSILSLSVDTEAGEGEGRTVGEGEADAGEGDGLGTGMAVGALVWAGRRGVSKKESENKAIFWRARRGAVHGFDGL